MRPIPAAEIRERFLRFFEERGHARMASDSLVPANDPTLLFTGAGMNQFKDMFLGRGSLPHRRVTTAQKCLRVPDLENVGATPRHHTFFEMLGHFSFGDYFKRECIRWEWEFFTEELGIPADQLVVTVYTDDDEAFAIWRDDIGLAAERIFRFGEKENFWPSEAPSKGPNGPCGPCSEIYFDKFPDRPYPSHEGLTELPDDRFTEVGNCVFTQFERRDGGELAPLPQKNIDVGLGLERIAAVLVDAPNNFGTDLFQPYIRHLEKVSGRRYGADPADDVRMRRIADHARAVTFCIADGALPSNEGRGYVVRKILRRAARDGFDLGLEEAFLAGMVDVVGEVMGDAYPEVRERASQCRTLIQGEEESFRLVYRQGIARLDDFLARHAGGEATHPRGTDPRLVEGSGEFAFQLHDTFGFPVDITRQVLLDNGLKLDEDGFDAAMAAQRERARAASATTAAVFAENVAMSLREAGLPVTDFIGYDAVAAEARVLALVRDGRLVDRAGAGDEVVVVTDVTPCYAQGGGQVGDRGSLTTVGAGGRILDTTALDGYSLHELRLDAGELAAGQSCQIAVDIELRRATEANHTATHLLHAALRRVLGEHVAQAGSEVSPERLRFDFTHGEKPTPEQLERIEDEVNAVIQQALPVEPCVQRIADAKAAGFLAMFGEKYADEVRTIQVGEFSRELCGGTHVRNTGNIGLFRIVAEQAVSAGTRRIEAVTAMGAVHAARREQQALGDLGQLLKAPSGEVGNKVRALLDETRRLRKELEKAQAVDLGALLERFAAAVEERGDTRVAVLSAGKLQMKELQELLTRARQKFEPFAGVVLAAGDDGVLVGAAVSKERTDRLRAGDVVKELTGLLGGGGGGRPDMAQGKGSDLTKVDAAVARARELLAVFGA